MLGGGDAAAMRPVLRIADGDWERIGPGTDEPLPDGRRIVTWLIDTPDPHADIAYCYPYGSPEIEALVRETGGYWTADTIGVSQQGRALVRLSNGHGEPDGDRPGLYLIARQHSGETPGSWVLDGLLRRIVELGDAAPLVWAVPLSNTDGVEGGDYGKDNFPYDLNRAWGSPPMRHETLVIQRDIRRWRGRCRPTLGVDFHAPGACETGGVYCYLPNPDDYPEGHEMAIEWSDAVDTALGEQYARDPFGHVADYASRWETPGFTSFCASELSIPGLCMETPYALVGDLVLTRERYREIGRRTAEAVVGKLTNC